MKVILYVLSVTYMASGIVPGPEWALKSCLAGEAWLTCSCFHTPAQEERAQWWDEVVISLTNPSCTLGKKELIA